MTVLYQNIPLTLLNHLLLFPCTMRQAEEQRLQTEYLAFQEQEAQKQRERQTQIARSQEKAKKEVQKTLRKRRKALLKKEVQLNSFSNLMKFMHCNYTQLITLHAGSNGAVLDDREEACVQCLQEGRAAHDHGFESKKGRDKGEA